MGDEPLLQKARIQEDIESDNVTRVNDGDGDGPVTLIVLFTTFTALCGTFSYGTAVIFFIFTSFVSLCFFYCLMFARLKENIWFILSEIISYKFVILYSKHEIFKCLKSNVLKQDTTSYDIFEILDPAGNLNIYLLQLKTVFFLWGLKTVYLVERIGFINFTKKKTKSKKKITTVLFCAQRESWL